MKPKELDRRIAAGEIKGWQITKAQAVAHAARTSKKNPNHLGGPSKPENIERAHRASVEQALAAGKPVPASVLADYPDLKAPASTPQAQPPAAKPTPVQPTAKPATEGQKGEGKEPPKGPTINRAKDELSPDNMTSGRNVDFNRDLKAFGKGQLDSPERRSQAMLHKKAIKEWPAERTDEMVREKAATNGNMSDEEQAAVVVRLAELKNEYRRIGKEVEGITDKAVLASKEAEFRRIEELASFTMAVNARSKTRVAQALAAAKYTVNDAADLVTVLARAKAQKGSTLTDAERQGYKDAVTALEKKNADIEAKLKEMQDEAVSTAVKGAKKARTSRKPKDDLNKLIEKARTLIKGGCH